jgi:alkylation response protein AidB-like acyl-CoA dehydrogenase
VRRFAAAELAPNAARWDRDKEFPREALKGLAAMGLYGVAIAEEWGGAGLGYGALAVACEEIAAGDCATATIVSVNNLVAGILAGYGSAAQKEQFLRPLAQGKLIGAFMLTEPQAGSDASAITTRAEAAGQRLRAERSEAVHHFGKNADIAVVFAVTDKDAGKRESAPFWSRLRRPATSWPASRRKPGSAHRIPRRSSWKIVKQSIYWPRKAPAIASRSRISNPGASTVAASGDRGGERRLARRSPMRASAAAWASR